MFRVKPEEVKLIFIVSKVAEDSFLSFLFNLGYSWIERDFDQLSNRLEGYGVLLLKEEDTRLPKVFKKFYDKPSIIYYFVGTTHLMTEDNIDIFLQHLFVKKEQWSYFNQIYKNIYGQTFEELLNEIK